MEIVSSFIQTLMPCIGQPVIRQFGYLKTKENVDELMRRTGDLEAKKKDIQDKIDAAPRDGRQSTHEATRWIEKVEGLGSEVTEVQSHNDQRGRCWPNCWSSYKIGRRASKLVIKMGALDTEHARLGVLTEAPPAPVQQMSSTSNVVGNMISSNKEKICGYLREETNEIIGIWGMGGVGKTTLLEAVNDNFLNNNVNPVNNKLFDHVIFIVVSKEHRLENLQKIIVEKLCLPSTEGLVSQARIIYEYLKKKNFLLLLDDIWKVVQLKDLGIPDPRISSSSGDERRLRHKVVFTTRSLQVCTDMNRQGKNIQVECLEPEEAWNLFKENVGEGTINLPGIMRRAKEVTEKCGGLPLALVVNGRAMATKRSPKEWDYALTQLRKSQPSNIPGMNSEEYYFPKLKLSYDSLQDDKMRKCFLCCSLWPEDFEISKEDLVMCWMGLGLIDCFEDIDEAYNEGYSLIGSLIVASLLKPVQDKDTRIKVHDVIRDLALWIARDNGTNINRWLVEAGLGLEEVPSKMIDKWRVAERVSLMENKIKELPPRLPLCPNLLTLLLQENQLTGIPEGFFTCMPNLTYLDLSYIRNLREFPKEICCLVQLRYLNLSFTNISTLPEELGRLINLKYLLLRATNLSGGVIRGIIGRLLKLEFLDLYPSVFVETEELLCLPPLLKGVGMKITSEDALQQLSRVVPPILHLNIEDIGDSSTTSIHLHHLLSSGTQVSLRDLYFCRCRSMRELDVDVGLPRLESLLLSELENMTEITWRRSVLSPSECFESLRRLRIQCCHGLKDIKWVLHLPRLQVLELSCCNGMEQLVAIGGGREEEREKVTKPTTFPNLRKLELTNLPKLSMICDNHAAVNFPYLERLELNKLPKLAMIWDNHAAVNFPSLEELAVRECNGLKDITWVLHLPRLEKLYMSDCNEMEQLVAIGGGEEEVTKPTFPRLTWLTLLRLPKLVMICDNHAAAAAVNFPSLEIFHVLGCNELKWLPFHPQQLLNNCSRLKLIFGDEEWWESIQWEDQSARSSLQPYFFLSPLLYALPMAGQGRGRRRGFSSRPFPPTTSDAYHKGVSEDDFINTNDGLFSSYTRSSVDRATLSLCVPLASTPGATPGLTPATTTPETTPVVPIGTNPYPGLLLDHGVYVRRPGFADPPTLPERPANIRRPELWADGAMFFPVQAGRELGELMRHHFHGPYLNFGDIPPDRRFIWLEMLAKMYWWPEHRDESILKCYKFVASKRLRDMINDQKALSLLPGDQRKEWLKKEFWEKMKEKMDTPEYKVKCEKAKAVRAKNGHHTGVSIP